MIRRRPRALSLAFALAASAGAGAAGAADWQFDPYVEAGAQYNDNYTLSNVSAQKVDLSGAFIDAGIQWRANAPRSNWTFEPRIRSSFFPDESQFESTDYFFNLLGEQRGERSAIGLAAELNDQDIVQSQLPGAVLDNIDLGQGGGPDSGRILGDNRQTLIRARPYARFDLNERVQLNIEGRAEDVSFDRDVINNYVSYQTIGAAIAIDRRFTEASRFGLRLDYQQTDPDTGAGQADLTGLQLRWDYQVGERLTAYMRGGAKRSKLERPGVVPLSITSTTETTPLFAAGLRYGFLKSELLVDAKREVDANSSGFVVERNDLRVYYNHRFTTRFRAYAAAYLIDDESVTATGAYAPRRYYTGSAGLEWRFRQSLALLGQIDRSSQEFSGQTSSADGNSARISVLYRPRRRD